MPGEWHTTTFQQLIDDGVLEIGDGYRAQNNELGGTGPIFLRAGHVTDTHIDFRGVERFHEHLATKVKPKMSRLGDTVVTTKGNSTGRTSFVTEALPPFVYSPHLSYWRSRQPTRLCGGFLRYWSQGAEFARQLSAMQASTDMAPYLSLTDQRRLTITLPPVAEQELISAVLGALDEKMDLNRRMTSTLEAMTRAMFQSWFVDFDPIRAKLDGRTASGLNAELAVLFPSGFRESALGKIPIGWDAVTFGKLLTPRRERVGDERLPEYSATVTGLCPRDARFKKQLSASQTKNKRTVRGDLVFGLSREVINFGLMQDRVGGVSPVYEVFQVNSELIEPELLENLLRFNMAQYMDVLKPGAREGKPIDRDYLLRKHVLVPNMAVQRAYLATIKPWVDRIKHNEAESRTLAALRDTLLPKLLSGELRVTPPPPSPKGTGVPVKE